MNLPVSKWKFWGYEPLDENPKRIWKLAIKLKRKD